MEKYSYLCRYSKEEQMYMQRGGLIRMERLQFVLYIAFGKDELIFSALPHFRTDAILRRENVDRYDDRDDIRTNLIDSYERLMKFIAKHLNDKFYLEKDQRISLRDKIFSE